MSDIKTTLDWLDNLCGQAMTEARSGNATLANKIGQHAALSMYLNNVYALRTMPRESWAAMYPQYLAEAETVRMQYEQAEQQAGLAARMTALEQALQTLQAQLSQVLEAAKPAAPAKKGKTLKEETAKTEEPEAEIPPAPDQPEGDTDKFAADDPVEAPEA